jgi:hypothetical protein
LSLFDKVFGRKNDPTADWPAAPAGPPPDVNLEARTLSTFGGRMAFGDPLDAARFLGRPDTFTGGANGTCTLAYHAHGLTIEFELNRFVEASFELEEDDDDASNRLARQRRGPDGLSLSSQTSRAEIVERFGPPGRTQDFDDEVILYYAIGPLVSEYQLDEDGRLVVWAVYLD